MVSRLLLQSGSKVRFIVGLLPRNLIFWGTPKLCLIGLQFPFVVVQPFLRHVEVRERRCSRPQKNIFLADSGNQVRSSGVLRKLYAIVYEETSEV